MGWSDLARNTAADAVGTVAVRASLHTTDPGATGAGEVAGGDYARQIVAWDPATGGVAALDDTVLFAVPAGETVTHAGIWTLAGLWLGGAAVTTIVFTTAGIYTLHPASTLSVV